MEISFFREILLVLLLFSLFVAWKVRQKSKSKVGCLGMGYVTLVVFLVGMFTVFITGFITLGSINHITTYVDGEKCVASVVSHTNYESEDDDGNTITMYTPTYRVTTEAGNVYEIESNFSSGGVPIVGDTQSIYFNEKTQKIVELSATTIIMVCGMFMMWIVLAFSFVGIVMYTFNCNMSRYFKTIQAVGMYFFLPFIMICFEALLIYGFFYGNKVPFFVSAILLFFILVLGLAIIGILIQLKNNGLPKWKKMGAGSYSGGWDDDEEPQNRRKSKKKKKEKMVSLNENYLKDTDNYEK